MLSVKSSLCGYFLIAIINYYGNVNAELQCYVCRGCEDFTDEDLETCSPPEGSGDEDPAILNSLEDLNDPNPGYRIQPKGQNSNSVNSPDKPSKTDPVDLDDITEEGEFIKYRASPHVILRDLTINRNEEEVYEPRCVVAWYQDSESSELNVVRGCTHESDNQEARCREAIGEGFTGILDSCEVCDRDGCNAAGKSAAVVLLLVIGVVINIFVY